MPSSRSPKQTTDEIFGGFAARLSQAARLPNINRYKALPQQELFHQSTKKGRILFGGNRGGKTYGGGADDVLILTKRHPYRSHLYPATGPIRMRFIGVDFDRGIDQGALPLFSQLIPPSFLKNGAWSDSYSPSTHMLTLEDGSTCSFMSYEQHANKFQVVSLHHIHFDEEPPKLIWDESMMRLVDTAGSWTLSETPVQQLEWVEDELIEPHKDGLRPDIDIFYLDTRDNTNLPPDELADLEANMSEEEKIVRLAGQYKGGSLVFPEFTRKWPNVIPQEAFKLTRDWTVYSHMDYGYANPTAWLWTAAHPDGSIITFRCLYSDHVIISEWAERWHAVNREIGVLLGYGENNDWRPAATVGDPSIANKTGAGQTGLTHQQAYSLAGVPIATEGIVKARSGNQNVGLEKIHTYLRKRPDTHPDKPGEPWWQITDNCTDLIGEVKKARKPHQTAANKEVQNTSEEIRDKDNHAIDASKYLFILTHDLRPVAYQAESDNAMQLMAEALGGVSVNYDTHQQVRHAMVSDDTEWLTSDSYSSLED